MRTAVLLSVFWFLALAALGTFFPFYSLYLNENIGLTASQTGFVMSMLPLVGMAFQPSWGHLADRSGQRARVLAAVALGAAVFYVALTQARGLSGALLGTALLATCSTAVIPMAVSTSLMMVRPLGPHAFGYVRVWGTIGFFCSVVCFPYLLDALSASRVGAVLSSFLATTPEASQPLLGVILPVTATALFLAAAIAWKLPRAHISEERAAAGDWRALFSNRAFLRLLGFTFFAYFFLQGPMALFPLFVRSLGGGVETVSQMWIFMLVLEVPLVALAGAGLARLGARGLIAMGIIAGSLRWILSATATSLELVYVAQLLHGVTVTGLVIGAPLYVEAVVPARLRSTGQGALAMVGVSLGGILSNISAGQIMDFAGPKAPALWGGLGAALLALALPWILPKPGQAPLKDQDAAEALAESLVQEV